MQQFGIVLRFIFLVINGFIIKYY